LITPVGSAVGFSLAPTQKPATTLAPETLGPGYVQALPVV